MGILNTMKTLRLIGTILSTVLQFNLNDGTYTFAVDAGYEDGGKFYALSDKAQVEFDIPDDYRKWNQDVDEVYALLDDIHGKCLRRRRRL